MIRDSVKKTRVYYIANARLPNEKAHGIQLAKMCEAFVEAGFDLRLIVPNKRNELRGPLEEFYGLKNKIMVTKLPVIDIWPASALGFNLSSLTFALSYFFYLLKKRLFGHGGIIYTIDLDQFSFFLIPFLGLPYFFETHATKNKSLLYWGFLKKALGIITINSWIQKNLAEKFKLAPSKFLVFPNGIDFEMFSDQLSKKQSRLKLNLLQNQKIIVYLGRFYDWKGLGIVAPAAEFLPNEFVFYLVGGTELQFKDVTAAKNLPKNIICVGSRPYQEMPLWVAAADLVLVLGTKANDYSYYQTSPMKIFEYMAVKRPMVASRTPAVQEIVSESEAFFYQPDNPESLGIAVREAMADEKKLSEITERAYKKVINYSWLNRATAIKNFISQSR